MKSGRITLKTGFAMIYTPVCCAGHRWEGYWRVMASGETKYKTGLLSSPGIRKDGSRISLEFSMTQLCGQTGDIQGCASIMRDVTERWNKEKELKARLPACESKLV